MRNGDIGMFMWISIVGWERKRKRKELCNSLSPLFFERELKPQDDKHPKPATVSPVPFSSAPPSKYPSTILAPTPAPQQKRYSRGVRDRETKDAVRSYYVVFPLRSLCIRDLQSVHPPPSIPASLPSPSSSQLNLSGSKLKKEAGKNARRVSRIKGEKEEESPARARVCIIIDHRTKIFRK